MKATARPHIEELLDGLRGLVADAETAQDVEHAVAELERVITLLEQSDTTIRRSLVGGVIASLLAFVAEAGPYRFETFVSDYPQGFRSRLHRDWLPRLEHLRARASEILAALFRSDPFSVAHADIENELLPLIFGAVHRYFPFRVIEVGKVSDKCFDLSKRYPQISELRLIHSLKYVRFGTSGWRARWGYDFTEFRAHAVINAICSFVLGEVPKYLQVGPQDGWLVVGYDTRRHADLVATWTAAVATRRGIRCCVASRPTPTPALVYWGTEKLGQGACSAIINCTASHNPVEWQGIKFSPSSGFPAPTNLTDYLGHSATHALIRGHLAADTAVVDPHLEPAEQRYFDPMNDYCDWILAPVGRSGRIPVDKAAIRRHFRNKKVVVDEMHGAGRLYLRNLLARLGVPHEVIHGESDPEFGELEYASPEDPYIQPLKRAVVDKRAYLGIGLDADADRFGIVDSKGTYVKPNVVLPILTYHYLRRGFQGKILRTVTGCRLTDTLAAKLLGNPDFTPAEEALPGYVRHPYYTVTSGDTNRFKGLRTYVVPVGIKYVAEGMLYGRDYETIESPNARKTLLIGGEESSGLTSSGHIPDKDGIWGDILVMNTIATTGKELEELWAEVQEFCDATSWFLRTDVNASDFAKERILEYLLLSTPRAVAGYPVEYSGGIRYDMVELQLTSAIAGSPIFLEVRASGTEPINRVYVEAPDENSGQKVLDWVLGVLDGFTVEGIQHAGSVWELTDILSGTEPRERVVHAVLEKINQMPNAIERLATLRQVLAKRKRFAEHRSRRAIGSWLSLLRAVGETTGA